MFVTVCAINARVPAGVGNRPHIFTDFGQALKLLCPLSSHPFARGVGVAYLLLLETSAEHNMIKQVLEGKELEMTLSQFVIQFVQALKFETHIDNPLARFLLFLANSNLQVGTIFARSNRVLVLHVISYNGLSTQFLILSLVLILLIPFCRFEKNFFGRCTQKSKLAARTLFFTPCATFFSNNSQKKTFGHSTNSLGWLDDSPKFRCVYLHSTSHLSSDAPVACVADMPRMLLLLLPPFLDKNQED